MCAGGVEQPHATTWIFDKSFNVSRPHFGIAASCADIEVHDAFRLASRHPKKTSRTVCLVRDYRDRLSGERVVHQAKWLDQPNLARRALGTNVSLLHGFEDATPEKSRLRDTTSDTREALLRDGVTVDPAVETFACFLAEPSCSNHRPQERRRAKLRPNLFREVV